MLTQAEVGLSVEQEKIGRLCPHRSVCGGGEDSEICGGGEHSESVLT